MAVHFVVLHYSPCGNLGGPLAITPGLLSAFFNMFIFALLFWTHAFEMLFSWHKMTPIFKVEFTPPFLGFAFPKWIGRNQSTLRSRKRRAIDSQPPKLHKEGITFMLKWAVIFLIHRHPIA